MDGRVWRATVHRASQSQIRLRWLSTHTCMIHGKSQKWENTGLSDRRSNQSILKEISLEYSSEGLMLKLKLQYFGRLMQRTDAGIDPDAGEDCRWEEKEATQDEMLDGITDSVDMSEYIPGAGDGQGGLACCRPRGCKELDMTEQLN